MATKHRLRVFAGSAAAGGAAVATLVKIIAVGLPLAGADPGRGGGGKKKDDKKKKGGGEDHGDGSKKAKKGK